MPVLLILLGLCTIVDAQNIELLKLNESKVKEEQPKKIDLLTCLPVATSPCLSLCAYLIY